MREPSSTSLRFATIFRCYWPPQQLRADMRAYTNTNPQRDCAESPCHHHSSCRRLVGNSCLQLWHRQGRVERLLLDPPLSSSLSARLNRSSVFDFRGCFELLCNFAMGFADSFLGCPPILHVEQIVDEISRGGEHV